MPSKVHDNDILNHPVHLATKQKPTDPKTLRDRINESNQHGPTAKRLLTYYSNKYGIPNDKTNEANKSKSNKGGKRRKSKKTKKSLKRH